MVDYQTKEIITLDEAARRYVELQPTLKDTDFGKDPVRAGILVFIDSEYLFITPMIPISETQLVSIEEYCKLEIDTERCDQIKYSLKLASMESKSKDPSMMVPAINEFLMIMKEINQESDLGLDHELYIVHYVLSINPKSLAEAEIIKTENGEFTSINKLSTIGVNGEKVILAQEILKYLDENKQLDKKQVLNATIKVIKILVELNNQ